MTPQQYGELAREAQSMALRLASPRPLTAPDPSEDMRHTDARRLLAAAARRLYQLAGEEVPPCAQ